MKDKMKNILNKTKEFILAHKKILGIVLAVIILIALIFAIVKTFGYTDQKTTLENRLEEIGRNFYENYYYKYAGSSDEEKTEILKKFETIGIKVDLDNLSRFNTSDSSAILSEFVNEKTNESCDKNNTRVIIYPQDPYDQTSYIIEVELDCGFEED